MLPSFRRPNKYLSRSVGRENAIRMIIKRNTAADTVFHRAIHHFLRTHGEVDEKKHRNVYRCFGSATDHPCSAAPAISPISHPSMPLVWGSRPEPQEAVAKTTKLTALACFEPPQEHARWSLRLLETKLWNSTLSNARAIAQSVECIKKRH
jgi:hypothetical protein